jgi:hypothetical protein
VLVAFAFIFSSTGLLQLDRAIKDQGLVYYSLSIFLLIGTAILACAIKDVNNSTIKNTEHSIVKLAKITFHELITHADYTVAILMATIATFQSQCCNRYGTFIVTDAYELQGKTTDEAQNHLSMISLVGNILSAFSCFGLGFFSDKI